MKDVRVGIVETGAGNRVSLESALRRAGATVERIRDAKQIVDAQALVLPGVANTGFVVRTIDERRLREPLCHAIERGIPVLAICAGFQALCIASDEAPQTPLLGLVNAVVRKIDGPRRQHVGWNRVETCAADDVIAAGWAYFTHGYAVQDEITEQRAVTTFGRRFISAIRFRNVIGVQFHPERSGAYGAALVERFIRIARGVSVG